MGVIVIMMNEHTFKNHKTDTIVRPKNYIKCSELVKRGLDSLILKPFEELIKSLKVPIYSNIDYLGHATGMFHT